MERESPLRDKPIIKRSDQIEFRFYLQYRRMRLQPLVIIHGEIVPGRRGGITIRARDFRGQSGQAALTMLITVLNSWRDRQ